MPEDYVPPLGPRYSQTYLERKSDLDLTATARRRIYRVFQRLTKHTDHKIAMSLEERLGVKVPGDYGWDWERYFEKEHPDTVMDSITIAWEIIDRNHSQRGGEWSEAINNIFIEEGMRYRVVDGLVRPYQDQAFETVRQLLLDGLNHKDLENARNDIKLIDEYLLITPCKYRQAIIAIFSATEEVVKLNTGQAKLTATLVKKEIRALAEQAASNTIEKRAINKAISSFADWVDACHFYRHAPGQPDPQQPSRTTAILLISGGYAWLRWLITILGYDDTTDTSSSIPPAQ